MIILNAHYNSIEQKVFQEHFIIKVEFKNLEVKEF